MRRKRRGQHLRTRLAILQSELDDIYLCRYAARVRALGNTLAAIRDRVALDLNFRPWERRT